MSQKKFVKELTVLFNETNAVGGVVYFSNYVKWQGVSREEYFIRTCRDWREITQAVMQGKVNLITAEEHSYFLNHAFFGDIVRIELQTANIRRYSFQLVFKMFRRDELLYEGFQKLAFDDFGGHYVPIPPSMLESVKAHEIDPARFDSKKLRVHLKL